MVKSVNTSSQVNQEPALPDNNEEVIQMLGLDGYADSNTGKLLDDIVRNLDLSPYTLTPNGVPAAAIGFESIQGHQQIVGNPHGAYSPTENVSYVDLSPVSPYGIATSPQSSPYHVPVSPVSSYGVDNSPQSSPYHVSEGSLSPVSPYHTPGGSFFGSEDNSPSSPQEVSSFVTVPTTPVGDQDHKPAGWKTPRRRRELKPKLYQREEPLSDPEEEKKRQNAINAKKNRDKQKNKLQELENRVNSLKAERDVLQATNTKLKNKCEAFERQLKNVCKQFNVPVIILPED